MKATAGHPQPGSPEHVPFASSLVLSMILHSALVLWLIGGAWLLSRMQSYRLSSHTVYLGGDSPFIIDQMAGEGGGASAAGQVTQEPGASSKAAAPEAGAEPAVEKFALPVEKPVPPPPKPVLDKAAPPPPKPVVEKPVPPPPAPKPVAEKAMPVPPKPPPDAMTMAEKQKETKPLTPPPTPTATEVQQRLGQLREQQVRQETADAKNAAEVQQRLVQLRQRQADQERTEQAAQQRVAQLRTEQTEKQAADQRVAALRERVGSGGTGEGSGASKSGAAGTGTGSGLPGSGRGTGTSGAGGVGTGGIAGIRLRSYQALIQEKVRNAWTYPPRSQGLEAVVYLAVDRAGHVEQLRFVRKSGNALFDESLQRAIKQAEPLPPLPDDYAGRLFEADLKFRALD